MDKSNSVEIQTPHITTWVGFYQALQEPPRQMDAIATTIQLVCPNLHRCLLQIAHLAALAAHQRSIRGISYKIQLDGLLMHLHHEVDLFESSSLDKAFLRALAIKRTVVP
jgi:hypothetical protein